MSTLDATQDSTLNPAPRSKALHIGLWVAQVALGLIFILSGLMKATSPMADLIAQMGWPAAVPEPMVRFIGVAELAGGIGLILPAATRIMPVLTAWAATGLIVVMTLASLFHASRGELGMLPVNAVFGGIAAFIAWGRFRKAPILPRS